MGFLLKKPADIQGKSWPAIVIGLFVAFGGVLFGYERPILVLTLAFTDCTTIDMTLEQSVEFWPCHTGKPCSRLDTETAKAS